MGNWRNPGIQWPHHSEWIFHSDCFNTIYWDLPHNKTSQSGLLLFTSFRQHCIVFGVCADPAACELVSFFCNCGWRLRNNKVNKGSKSGIHVERQYFSISLFIGNRTAVYLERFLENGEWNVAGSHVSENIYYLNAFPEVPFSSVIFTLKLERKVWREKGSGKEWK